MKEERPMSARNKPRRRKKGVAVQNLPHEVLVYDLERHRAHCLNEAAAEVWRQCNGQTTISEMAHTLEERLEVPIDTEFVRYAVDRLAKAHLLEGPPSRAKYSRRDFMARLKKLGLAASVALPVVSSIVSPTPAHAQSCVGFNDCSGRPDCTPCNNPGGNCGRWVCCNGKCVSPGQAGSCGC